MQLKDYILNELDQVLIYSIYFEIDVQEIEYNILHSNYKTQNPLRYDKHPSLSFKWYGNKLIARDFGDYRFNGDIFNIIGYILNLNPRDSKGFIEICTDIIDKTSSKHKIKRQIELKETDILKQKSLEIQYVKKRLNKIDYYHFDKYGISEEYTNKYIIAVDSYKLNGWRAPYTYRGTDPCYAYPINPNKIKLHFPYRSKKDYRFITNNRCPIECLQWLKPINYIVLIKAYKDAVLMKRICNEKGINDILFLPLAGETVLLTKELYNVLIEYCNTKKIFSLLDTDTTGINSMLSLKKTFNIEPIYFTQGYTSKDPTDMVKLYKYTKVFNHSDKMFKQIYYDN